MDQYPENQLHELLTFAEKRGWSTEVYIDKGVSGARDSRPELDRLMRDARRRRVDVVLCWRLDRLGRRLAHLLSLIAELQALGVEFVTLGEGLDTTSPSGRLQMHILGALAEFERARLSERVRAGLARVRARGTRLGRPALATPVDKVTSVAGLTVEAASRKLGVSRSTVKRWRRGVQKTASAA